MDSCPYCRGGGDRRDRLGDCRQGSETVADSVRFRRCRFPGVVLHPRLRSGHLWSEVARHSKGNGIITGFDVINEDRHGEIAFRGDQSDGSGYASHRRLGETPWPRVPQKFTSMPSARATAAFVRAALSAPAASFAYAT